MACEGLPTPFAAQLPPTDNPTPRAENTLLVVTINIERRTKRDVTRSQNVLGGSRLAFRRR